MNTEIVPSFRPYTAEQNSKLGPSKIWTAILISTNFSLKNKYYYDGLCNVYEVTQQNLGMQVLIQWVVAN
jgi:hypothetical protein